MPQASASRAKRTDIDLMEERQLVLPTDELDPQDADVYVHPNVYHSYDQQKGRHLRVSASIPAGTIVFADAPYALIPTVNPTSKVPLICSNLMCRRRVQWGAEYVACPNDCIQDVVWCNATCRTQDQARHDFECLWLKEQGTILRHKEGECDFSMLWLVVRLLAARRLEVQYAPKPSQRYSWEDRYKRGWQAIADFSTNRHLWPQPTTQHWNQLIEAYLTNFPSFPGPTELLDLICREEINSFGLYPGITGMPSGGQQLRRGRQYGLACYPRATILNHSCVPNLNRAPDDRGRMVATANRDIAADEECTIAYFDLVEHADLEERQRLTCGMFLFSCTCERCLGEAEQSKKDVND